VIILYVAGMKETGDSMKKYAGEEFLNRLYKDLIHSDEVKHTAKGANKNEDLALYFERLQRVSSRAKENKKLDLLKHFYYKKYIIKEEDIPESYFKAQEQLALERGLGHITYDERSKKEEIERIIQEQKESLDRWLEYFYSDDTNHYPMWFKYYVFQNVMKIGYFDKSKNVFTKRTNSTVKPFIEINREAIAMLYDKLFKFLDGKEITDEALEQLIKNGSFNKIYSYLIRKLDAVNKVNGNNDDGIWKKYDQGSDPEILFSEIYGKGTGWCTAGGIEIAKNHLDGGDFYVYFTKDDNGEYTNPRIAIRMEDDIIGEIRGIAEDQNIESEMEKVVEEKINEFPDKDEYKKKVSDMKELTKIYSKHKNDEDLTKEEIRFLYELDSKIIGFGYDIDPRIKEIKSKRNIRADLAKLYSVNEDEVSLTDEEFNEGNKKVHYGYLDLSFYTDPKDVVLPKYMIGNIYLNIEDAEGLELPEELIGNLVLPALKYSRGLILPKKMNGDLWIDNLIYGDGLVFPKEFNGSIKLNNLLKARGMILPEKLNGSLNLKRLNSTEGLVLPKEINGDLYLETLGYPEGLILPEIMNGSLNLQKLAYAEGLKFPDYIKGSLDLSGLIFSKGLQLPKAVTEELYLSQLEEAENLILPEGTKVIDLDSLKIAKNIVFPEKAAIIYAENLISLEDTTLTEFASKNIYFYRLQSLKNVVFPKELKKHLRFRDLTHAEGLVLPEILDGHLCFFSLTNANGITFPKNVTGTLFLEELTSAERLILPEHVGKGLWLAKLKNAENLVLPILSEEGKIDLSSLISARGLVLPECINGSLLLNSLMDIEGIMLPKNKKGEFYNPVTEYLICPFDEEELIEAAKRTETKQFELQSSDGNLKL